MNPKTYVVRATRSHRTGGWWAIDVPSVPGVFSQARRLDKVEAAARDALALMLGRDPDSFGITVEAKVDQDVQRRIELARRLRAIADAEQIAASQAMRDAARMLVDSGLTIRDVGQLLGITHQRVAQVLRAGERAASPSVSGGPADANLSLVDLMRWLEASVAAATHSAATTPSSAHEASEARAAKAG